MFEEEGTYFSTLVPYKIYNIETFYQEILTGTEGIDLGHFQRSLLFLNLLFQEFVRSLFVH